MEHGKVIPIPHLCYKAALSMTKPDAGQFFSALCAYYLGEAIPEMSETVSDAFSSALPLMQQFRAEAQKDRRTYQYDVWRKSVYERDNFTCQMCGKRGGKIHAHHVVPWAECISKRYDLSNGVTLCQDCHKAVHKKRRQK